MLRIKRFIARALLVPMRRPLVTAGGSVTQAPLVLLDLDCGEGLKGQSYLFAYRADALQALTKLIEDFGSQLEGQELAPLAIEEKLRGALRLLGAQGLTLMALSGIDMAAWDALAKSQDLPLAKLLGGRLERLQAYNSNGLGLIGAERAALEACDLVAEGFDAIKLRLGYPTLAEDLDVTRAVREAIGDRIGLMVDYNQSLTVPEAARRARGLAEERLIWIEEPVRADDFRGHATVRAASVVPIQTGENCWGPYGIAEALAAGASDFLMPDAGKIGGVSGWQRAAALTGAEDMPLSSHLYPEVSAHLLAATPNRHWLEFVDWAAPLQKEPFKVRDGILAVPDRPGIGFVWDEKAIAEYQV